MKITLATLAMTLLILTASAVSQDKPGQHEKKDDHGFALKQLRAFHDALHPLVHDALPKGDLTRIRKNLDKLLERAKAIQKAKLPKDLAGRKQEFQNTSAELVRQLTDMISMKDKVDDETLEKSFNEMHDTFEQLAEIAK